MSLSGGGCFPQGDERPFLPRKGGVRPRRPQKRRSWRLLERVATFVDVYLRVFHVAARAESSIFQNSSSYQPDSKVIAVLPAHQVQMALADGAWT